jgi:glucose-6-phosphate 1-dehydrogenase
LSERKGELDVNTKLVVLGARGDLATRHILPALFSLQSHNLLSPEIQIIGVDRQQISGHSYRAEIASKLASLLANASPVALDTLVQRFDYFHADLEGDCDLAPILTQEPVVAYLALPPSVYRAAAGSLKAGGILPESRIVVEKPFGEDLASAQALTRLLQGVTDARNIYRVDHFLHHQIVQDLLALRFATPFFEPLWHRGHIERVEITWEEASSVSGRGAYYDNVGALKDMVQSHLLQLLALVAMERPARLNEDFMRRAKTDIFSKVILPLPGDIAHKTARGRYTAGKIGANPHHGYVEEPGVDRSRNTETYAYLQLAIDADRWRGVPFVLRTGKALAHSRRRISIRFRKGADNFLPSSPAELILDMAPDHIRLTCHGAGPHGLPELTPVSLESCRPPQQLPPSARMLRDVMARDLMFAIGSEEIEHCWRIVDAIHAVWSTGVPPLQNYAAGSAGPLLPGEQT